MLTETRAITDASTFPSFTNKSVRHWPRPVQVYRTLGRPADDDVHVWALTIGFTLDEIAGMFTPQGEPRIDRQVLAAKADELDHLAMR